MERTPESEDAKAPPNVPDDRENAAEERSVPWVAQLPREMGGPYLMYSAQT